MVLFVTMKTRSVKIVVALVTANTIAPNSETLLLTSSVVFVAALGIWLAIAQLTKIQMLPLVARLRL